MALLLLVPLLKVLLVLVLLLQVLQLRVLRLCLPPFVGLGRRTVLAAAWSSASALS